MCLVMSMLQIQGISVQVVQTLIYNDVFNRTDYEL